MFWRNRKSSKEKEAENLALARSISKKIDSLFEPVVAQFSNYFNQLNLREKYTIIAIVFTILFILTYIQWKQIAP